MICVKGCEAVCNANLITAITFSVIVAGLIGYIIYLKYKDEKKV